MSPNTFARRITSGMSGALVAAGIIMGSMVIGESARAQANPSSSDQCATLPMPGGQDGTAPNALTRTGQGSSDGAMTVTCQAVGHS